MLFRKKTKDEEILLEMKKKKEEIDKLKTKIETLKKETVDMGKLILKDGKLVNADSVAKEVPQAQVQPQVQEQFNEAVRETVVKVQARPSQQMPQQFVDPDADIIYEAPRRQSVQQHEEEFDVPRPPQQYRQAQPVYVEQPQQYQQPRQVPRQPVMVSIELLGVGTITVGVELDKFEKFQQELDAAIDNQSCFPLDNKVINGRNIVLYTFE